MLSSLLAETPEVLPVRNRCCRLVRGDWIGMVAERLQAATANLMPPFAVVDLDALDDNATSMITRAR